MGFLDTIKEVITNKPLTLREPKFIEKFTGDNKQLEDLEKLLTIAPKEISKQIEQDIKLLHYGISGEKNKTIIKFMPKTIEELKAIKGFGDVKCERYGQDIINIVNKY